MAAKPAIPPASKAPAKHLVAPAGHAAAPAQAPGVQPAPGGKRTEHHDTWVRTLAGRLKHDVSALLAGPALSNARAGAETALVDIKAGVTKAGGQVLHKDVSKSLAADGKQRARIAAGADTHSFAFKAANVATHVVVDTAATVAVAAAAEPVLVAAGLEVGVAGMAATTGLRAQAAKVAGKLVMGATANAVGSGAVTGLEGGHAKDVLRAAAVGGLSVGVGHAVGEAVTPLSKAAAGRVARAAPKLSGASGKLVQVGSEAVTGAATGAGVSALAGDKPHDIAQNALFGGVLSSVSAVFHARGAHEPTPEGQPRPVSGQPQPRLEAEPAQPHTQPHVDTPAGGPPGGTPQPPPRTTFPSLGRMKDALRPVGETIRLGGTKMKHTWNAAQDVIRPAAVFKGTTPFVDNPVTHGSVGSQFAVFPRSKPGEPKPAPSAFFTSPQLKVAVPHGVPLLGGATFTGGGTYSYNIPRQVDAAGASFTLTKPIAMVPGTDFGVSGGIWGSVGQSGTITPRKVLEALRDPQGIPEQPFKMTINLGLIGSAGGPGFKLTGGTMHTLYVEADMEGNLNRLALNNTELPLGPFRGVSIGWPHRVILGGLNRLGAAKHRRYPAPNAAGATDAPGHGHLRPAQDVEPTPDGTVVSHDPLQGRDAGGGEPTLPGPPQKDLPDGES